MTYKDVMSAGNKQPDKRGGQEAEADWTNTVVAH